MKVFWKYPQLLPIIKHPYYIEVELTNNCNLKCIQCHRKIMNRKIGYMSFDLFKKLIAEVSEYPLAFLRFVGQGECALHPEFGKFMDYLVDKPFKIEVTTNGLIFERFSPQRILNWNIDLLAVSIDGYNRDEYHKIRVQGDYDKLLENMDMFYAERNLQKKDYPKINVRNVVFPDTAKEDIERFKEFWIKRSDMVTFHALTDIEKTYTFEKYNRCREIFFDAHVRWDGSVPLCQHRFIFGEDDYIGNLNDNTLSEIVQNETLQKLRIAHQQGRISDLKACRGCFKIHGYRMTEFNTATKLFDKVFH